MGGDSEVVCQFRVPEESEQVFVLVLSFHKEQESRRDLPAELLNTLVCQGSPNALTIPAHTR